MESTEPQEPSYYEIALTNRQVLVAFVALLACVLVAFFAGVWIGRGAVEENAKRRVESVGNPPAPATEVGELTFFNTKNAPGKAAPPARDAATKPSGSDSGDAKPVPAAPAGAKPVYVDAEAKPAAAAKSPASGDGKPAGPSPSPPPAGPSTTTAAPVAVPAGALSMGPAAAKAGAAAKNDSSVVAKATPAEPLPASPGAGASSAKTSPAVAAPVTAAPAPPVAARTYFVQVYSSTNETRANQIVGELKRGGYATQVATFDKDGAKHFRVRVGPFPARDKADAASVKLKKGYKLDTWVTDTP